MIPSSWPSDESMSGKPQDHKIKYLIVELHGKMVLLCGLLSSITLQ